jgi:hypothetical protein
MRLSQVVITKCSVVPGPLGLSHGPKRIRFGLLIPFAL